MQIRDVKCYVLKDEPEIRRESSADRGSMAPVPPGISGLFTHDQGFGAGEPDGYTFTGEGPEPKYRLVIRLVTDGDLDAYADYGTGFDPRELEWQGRQFLARYAHMLIGVDAFYREYVWQRFWMAQRFMYTGRGLLDTIDRMLWDLASRSAGLPIYKLLGACRESVPAYCNVGGRTIDDLVAHAVQRVEGEGFIGCKDHSYRGVKANGEMAVKLREALGDEIMLFHDPVESYTYEEAVKIGRIMEKCRYRWIEEPLQDYDILGLKKLCATLDLPVLTLEWIGAIGGQPYNTAPYLAMQAADIVRQRGIGITGQIKQAQLAESFGVEVHGGDPHVILAIGNDPVFEAFMGLQPRPPEEELDCRGTLVVEDGAMSIAWSDRPAPEPDWDETARSAVAVI
ncbi:MAG: hypothetical protein F4X08_10280 [Gemmatimonadetes bacterium]|nr:hypothetical protein [Gemmatimonadota bacterium]MYD26188.1 hypothetical protein [Gemmatimonadota bacterium]MYI99277.1 hypothetical protein [Gemmatimonadota bacterium]